MTRFAVIARTLIDAPSAAIATDRLSNAINCDGLPRDVDVEAFSAEDDAKELTDLLALRGAVDEFLTAPKLGGKNHKAFIALLDMSRAWNGIAPNEPLRIRPSVQSPDQGARGIRIFVREDR